MGKLYASENMTGAYMLDPLDKQRLLWDTSSRKHELAEATARCHKVCAEKRPFLEHEALLKYPLQALSHQHIVQLRLCQGCVRECQQMPLALCKHWRAGRRTTGHPAQLAAF